MSISAAPPAAIEHALTHVDWVLQPVRHRLPHRVPAIEASLPEGQWVAVPEALRMGLPAPVRRLLEGGGGGGGSVIRWTEGRRVQEQE